MEKVVKKEKEEFEVTVLNFQEHIAKLVFQKDDMEQYWRRICF